MALYHAKAITTVASCHYLLRREPVLTNRYHPGYLVRENTNIPINLLEVVPLLTWYMIYHNTVFINLCHMIDDTSFN